MVEPLSIIAGDVWDYIGRYGVALLVFLAVWLGLFQRHKHKELLHAPTREAVRSTQKTLTTAGILIAQSIIVYGAVAWGGVTAPGIVRMAQVNGYIFVIGTPFLVALLCWWCYMKYRIAQQPDTSAKTLPHDQAPRD